MTIDNELPDSTIRDTVPEVKNEIQEFLVEQLDKLITENSYGLNSRIGRTFVRP